MKSYSIDSASGNLLCAGLPAHTARATAQRIADERDEVVTLYSTADDGEEIEPTEIKVDLEAPCGPRVMYGAQDTERVELEIPEGWIVAWASAINLAPGNTTRATRYSAPLAVALYNTHTHVADTDAYIACGDALAIVSAATAANIHVADASTLLDLARRIDAAESRS